MLLHENEPAMLVSRPSFPSFPHLLWVVLLVPLNRNTATNEPKCQPNINDGEAGRATTWSVAEALKRNVHHCSRLWIASPFNSNFYLINNFHAEQTALLQRIDKQVLIATSLVINLSSASLSAKLL